jgi:hypothetical protein
VLASLGLLTGPDLIGGNRPVVETTALVVLGAVAGWWLARRGARAAAS